MKKLLAVTALGVAFMAARPGNEFNLLTQLNGTPSRWVTPDGGRSGAFSSTSSACFRLTPATNSVNGAVSPNVVVVVPLTAGNICIRPSVFSPVWDGGCNTIPGDENYGLPLQAGVPFYFVPDNAATTACVMSDAGTVTAPAFTVQ